MKRAVIAPGVPLKSATGRNRIRVELLRYSAADSESPEVGMDVQLLPESAEYCQLPSATESAVLAVIATALRVSLSVSEKDDAKSVETLSPEGSVLSSETEARDGLPLAIGASLTASMDVVRLTN